MNAAKNDKHSDSTLPNFVLHEGSSLGESAVMRVLHKFLPHGRPRIMTEESAKAQGVFLPNWWLAIMLIPLVAGILWVITSLTRIQTQQENIQALMEFRMKSVETKASLNAEHEETLRLAEAKLEGEIETVTKFTAAMTAKSAGGQ